MEALKSLVGGTPSDEAARHDRCEDMREKALDKCKLLAVPVFLPLGQGLGKPLTLTLSCRQARASSSSWTPWSAWAASRRRASTRAWTARVPSTAASRSATTASPGCVCFAAAVAAVSRSGTD